MKKWYLRTIPLKIDARLGLSMNAEQLPLFRRTIASGWSEDETQLFLLTAERAGLDPFARYLYVARDRGEFRIESTIDGFRFAAERTGKYAGQIGPHWCGPDGKWKAIWTGKEPPTAARVGILRSDFAKPIWGKALYSEYAQPGEFWRDMPANQLAKCAEAAGFRKAFPVLSGLYTDDELGHTQVCRGAVMAGGIPYPHSETGDDPAIFSTSTPVSSEPVASLVEHGGESIPPTQILSTVPLPLQPFVDQPMTRKNIQACFGFIQAELERLYAEEGTRIFRRLWLALPRVFKTKEEARIKTVACWVAMWGYVEAAERREAA